MYENILHEYNFTTKIFACWLAPDYTQHFPNCCCPYILVYMVASNTTICLLFTSHLFYTLCDLLN